MYKLPKTGKLPEITNQRLLLWVSEAAIHNKIKELAWHKKSGLMHTELCGF